MTPRRKVSKAVARVLAVIPARGGSKGVPNKNITSVAGVPLIAHTILLARKSRVIDRCVVSTDSRQIAEIAMRYGAEAPFLRPAALARDETPGIPPILHAVRWLAEHEHYYPTHVMVLQPTSPLRTVEDIERPVRLALEKKADGVVSVCPATPHPYWVKSMTADGRLSDFLHVKGLSSRRQDLPPAFQLNGAVYLVTREVLLRRRTCDTERTFAYLMPRERSLDIDSAWDLRLADLLLRSSRNAR